MDEKKVDEKKLEDVNGGISGKVGEQLYDNVKELTARLKELEKSRQKRENKS